MQTKFKALFFRLVILSILNGCSGDKEEACVNDTLSNTIVGNWSANVLGSSLGDVEFNSDGTLIDPSGAVISGELMGVPLNEKSYTTNGDNLLIVRAESGSNFINSVMITLVKI